MSVHASVCDVHAYTAMYVYVRMICIHLLCLAKLNMYGYLADSI